MYTTFFKKKIREILRAFFLNKKYQNNYQNLVILSTGRSGSTLLTDLLIEAFLKKYFIIPSFLKRNSNIKNQSKKMVYEFIKELKNINSKTAPIIKSHDSYLNESSKIKHIFIFRNPLNIISSILYKIDNNEDEFLKNHILNLNGSFSIEDILEKDVLNYIGISSSFLNSKRKDEILFFDFKDFNSNLDYLSKNLKLDIEIPNLDDRHLHPSIEKLNKSLKNDLMNSYNLLRNQLKY